MELIRGRNCKESRIVAYENIFVNFMCKLVFHVFYYAKEWQLNPYGLFLIIIMHVLDEKG